MKPAHPHPEQKSQTASENDHTANFSTRIRSFVLRQGRLTTGQQRAIQDGGKWMVPYQASMVDWHKVFGRQAQEHIVEIGFGMGATTAEIARNMPEKDFIAVEVHTPGVGSLLKLMQDQQIHNIRIVQHDAVEVMQHMLAPNSLDGIHIFFPDPWHKKRHHKRRLIQADFIQLLLSRMKPGAYLHIATDWQDYAEWILDVLIQTPGLRNRAAQDYMPRPAHRPLTKFEQRGIKLGHGVWDLLFEKRAD